MPLALAFFTRSRKAAWVELAAGRHLDAQVVHQLGVVVDLDRRGLEREAVGALAEGPGLLRPGLDVGPVDAGRKIGEEVVVDVVGLVDLGVEDVGRLAGAQRGLQRGVQRRLLVPGDLDLDARATRLEALDGVLDVGPLGDFCRPMAPDGELLRPHCRRRGEQRHEGRGGEGAPGACESRHGVSLKNVESQFAIAGEWARLYGLPLRA